MRQSSALLGGGIFALIGLSFALVSWNLYKSDQVFWQQSAPATGMVVRSDYIRAKKGRGSYYAVVSFQTSESKKYEFRSGVGSGHPIYKDGEQVGVRYEIQNPANAKIAGFWELWGLTAVLGGFGVVFVFVGIIIGLKRR